jgi:hypothetical protein
VVVFVGLEGVRRDAQKKEVAYQEGTSSSVGVEG